MLITNASSVSLTAMTFDHNYVDSSVAFSAGGAGLAVINGSTVTIRDSVFTFNDTRRVGGGLMTRESNAFISNKLFDNNRAALSGAAIIFSKSNVGANVLVDNIATIEHSLFTNNKVVNASAGDIRNDGMTLLTISHTDFIGNSAASIAGALSSTTSTTAGGTPLNTEVVLSHVNFISNTAGNGGGALFANSGATATVTATLDHVNFSGNSAVFTGGAIYYGGNAAFLISHSTFDSNTAGQFGGAIASAKDTIARVNAVELSIDYSSFNNNSAANGGAIFDNAALIFSINKSQFTANVATGSGGAVMVSDLTTITSAPIGVARTISIQNTIFRENAAAVGGALHFVDHATDPLKKLTLTLDNSHFIKNAASISGGAFYQSGGQSLITNNHFLKSLDASDDQIVIDLPSMVNGQVTGTGIVKSLDALNKVLRADEILILP